MTTSTHVRGLVLTEHRLPLPLDPARPDGEQVEVFAREVAAPDGADRPFLLFLQGGPGQEAPRPTGVPANPAWLPRALQDYRVLMLDQRGTGNSTAYGEPGDPAADAERLTHHRADAIVRDAEAFREHLGVRQWSVLGQSFGGFCALHYLSVAPDSLREVYFTGGLPPVGLAPEEMLRRDVRDPAAAQRRAPPPLPGRCASGWPGCSTCATRARCSRRTATRSRAGSSARSATTLGMDGGSEALHFLLERDPRSPAFRHDLVGLFPFAARNPLYAVIHESSYADGHPTRWAAQRSLPDDFAGDSLLLTAEHLYPVALRGRPRPRAVRRGGRSPRRAALAGAVRRRRARLGRRAVRGRDLRPRRLRHPALLRADGRAAAGDAALADRRVPPQRPAHRRRPRARPADRAGPRRL